MKLHQLHHPIRPLTNCKMASPYNLAIYLNKVIDFIEKLNNINIPHRHKMIYLDIKFFI